MFMPASITTSGMKALGVLVLSLVSLVLSNSFPLPGETVVVVALYRHGVRSPDNPPDSDGRPVTTANFTTKKFPPWTDSDPTHPAGDGGLTANGADVLKNFGNWFRTYYPVGASCTKVQNNSYIYVDVSQRCQDSATAWWEGYSFNCDIPTTVQPPTHQDKSVYPGVTLFKHYTNGFDLENCHGNNNETFSGGNITRRQVWMIDEWRDEFQAINEILGNNFDKSLCYGSSFDDHDNCNLFGIPIEEPDWTDSQYLRGPMGYANYWANYFLTQYFDGQEVAFGDLWTEKDGFRQTKRIGRVHYAQDMLQGMSPSAAFCFGSELFGHMLTSIEQAAKGEDVNVDTINHSFWKKLVTYFGHHENVSYLITLLQLQLVSEENDWQWIPFSGGLQLRLYKDTDPDTGKENLFISFYFITPTPTQHRTNTALNDDNQPSIEQLQAAWCTDSSGFLCRYSDFKRFMLSRFKTHCIYDTTLANYLKKQRAISLIESIKAMEEDRLFR
uniref:Acid phosphatase n=1 Tax=Paramoeba aestuarina TaxID=180227 RepID=A0A7S4PIA3_9EUKA